MKTGYQSKMRRSRPAGHNGRGFSLIEVLVVLVILVIGIFSILRLFPGGFFTIQRTGEITSAQALSAQQLDVQKSQIGIPESVVALQRDSTGALIVDPNITPNDLSDLNANGMTAIGLSTDRSTYFGDPHFWSNINRIRHIIGETFRVPTPSPNSGKGFGAIYMLQHGPVLNQLIMENGVPTDSLSVYGTPMERIEMNATVGQDNTDSNLVLNNENQYAIDYTKGLIAFYPRAGTGSRQFRITYDYYVAGSNGSPYALKSVVSGPSTVITVPDDNTVPAGVQPLPRWVSLFGSAPNHLTPPSGFITIRKESEDVSRKFRLVSLTPVDANPASPANPNFTTDPYEYAWYSPQKPDATGVANVGVLIFNPHGHNQLIQTSAGPQPITVRVDYTTYDNHIVREDRTVPNQSPYFVKLSLPFVLTNGDILSDQSTDTGMFRDPNKNATPDILIYNANTGDEIGEYTNNKAIVNPNDPTLAGLSFNVDTRSGSVTFNPDSTNANYTNLLSLLQSATLRFYYRARNEWGMQIQKANAHYIQSFDPANDMTYNSYYVGGTEPGIGSRTRIYFPLCEAGKSVVLGEYWVSVNDASGNPVLDPNGKPLLHRFSGEMYKINDNPSLFQSLNGNLLTWIDVLTQHPEAAAPDAVHPKYENWQFTSAGTGQGAVSNIEGGSIKSRIIWKDGERWRILDNDTFLPAASGR